MNINDDYWAIGDINFIELLTPYNYNVLNRSNKRTNNKLKKQNKSFKDYFVSRFNIDRDKFKINLIKISGRWCIEIKNILTHKVYYQDLNVIAEAMGIEINDIKELGLNIDREI